ncbi:MAG: endonuclease/exonuclease/phosphatase family protein [Thiohalocapsa sp.]|jgi:endonuclease/exonuclease/phosphatase family metal-dependent hydrolase|uniref:endonuclease/exonuclease/phosphatase family protein n=1 Tax=Thiohalocapsa sp. TaxID=2497641 RepID=UPI0025CE2E4D|nr:endonuclease/exonuclease/phosphatase family protein [Thiohalocapsa sp.]MCG6941372.1 endonuclease/exonuclease/phosphatase family protein [Thiohalocapsa sp.]
MTREFSVLTYNIHKGFSMGGRQFVLHRMRDALAQTGADVVFLQEALGQHDTHAQRLREWPQYPQFEFLADTVWPHHAYGRNALYGQGHHGNAILSRYPFVQWENIDVSPYPFAASRSLMHGVIELPGSGTRLHLVCVHFGFFGVERRPQIRRLCERIEAHVPHDEPLVVAGDFNDWSGRAERHFNAELGLVEVFRTLHGEHARTWPAMAPVLPMDRIYYRGAKPLAAERLGLAPWRDLSDHTPLQAWFRL